MRRVLVTGSRNWTDARSVHEALTDQWAQSPNGMTVVVGDALGADALARAWVRRGYDRVRVEVHVADWAKHGKPAGPIRNQEMVDSGADVCLAFPVDGSRGTRHCMAAAARAGIPVIVVPSVHAETPAPLTPIDDTTTTPEGLTEPGKGEA